MTKRIAVLGTGANGASIGADLTNAGHDVTLIDQWPENVAAMRKNGVRVEMPGRTVVTPVRAYNLCDVCTFTEPFDIVLMVLKAYDARWGAHLIEPYLKADGLLVGVQNGMTADTIAEVVGPDRTMGSVLEISSAMMNPGVVTRDSPHDRSWFAVGSLSPGARGRESEVAELLRCSGAVDVVDNIQATKWMKLVSNATTLVSTAILGASIHEAAAIPEMRALMVQAGQEALDVGEAIGHPALPIFGLKSDSIHGTNRLVDTLLDALLSGFTLPSTKTTVLQDWVKGRHSEVDDLNGLVAKTAKRLGRTAPVNEAITDLAHQIERGQLKPGFENLQKLVRWL